MSDVSRRDVLQAAGVLGMAATFAATAGAQSRPSADDLVKAVKGARLFDLSFVWNEQAPVLGLNPPYSFALNRTRVGAATPGSSAATFEKRPAAYGPELALQLAHDAARG